MLHLCWYSKNTLIAIENINVKCFDGAEWGEARAKGKLC